MGLGGDHYMWKPQIDYFSKRPHEFQTLVYDNRGVGFSDQVRGRFTTNSMARDALDVMNHIGWKSNIHLIGLSMGGMITQEIAKLDLPRFRSMTLISTIAGGISSLLFLLRAPGLITLFRTLPLAILSTDPSRIQAVVENVWNRK